MLTLAIAVLLAAQPSIQADVLFVSNSFDNTITKFTPDGVGSVFANTGLQQPEGLAFDSLGNLFVANWSGNTIVKFTPDGMESVFANTGLNNPQALAFDSQGNLAAVVKGRYRGTDSVGFLIPFETISEFLKEK